MSLLNATEEWLYDEGEDQPKKVYVERFTELKKYGDPVLEREKEHMHRDTTFNELGQTIVRFEKFLLEHEAGVSFNILFVIRWFPFRMRSTIILKSQILRK